MTPASPLTLLDSSALPLEQQVVRLQALLEASRRIHSTIELEQVLREALRIAVLELELKGALFTGNGQYAEVSAGEMPARGTPAWELCPRFPVLARSGEPIAELLVDPSPRGSLSLYETDFLEGLVLQTALAAENALNHQRNLDYARLAQDLQAARQIQQSLLPQSMPELPGYSLAARSTACYEVGGDYLDILAEPGGTYLLVIADVAGKGLASALVCAAFRAAFRALARQPLPLEELAARLSQQHWDEGTEARRRYVTAFFARLDLAGGALSCVNAGHNPALLCPPGETVPRLIEASGTPLGLLPGARYTPEHAPFPAGARLLLYTDGLTEVFRGDEEFGTDRLAALFGNLPHMRSENVLAALWDRLSEFTGYAPQGDDMTAVALCHLLAAPGRGVHDGSRQGRGQEQD